MKRILVERSPRFSEVEMLKERMFLSRANYGTLATAKKTLVSCLCCLIDYHLQENTTCSRKGREKE